MYMCISGLLMYNAFCSDMQHASADKKRSLFNSHSTSSPLDPVLKEAAMNAAGPTNVTPSPLPAGQN